MGKKKKDKNKSFIADFPDFNIGGTNLEQHHVPIVARELRDRIKDGAGVDALCWYKAKALRDTLSFFRIVGRSKLTTKEEMAEALVLAFGDGEDNYGSRTIAPEHVREEMKQRMIRNIMSSRSE